MGELRPEVAGQERKSCPGREQKGLRRAILRGQIRRDQSHAMIQEYLCFERAEEPGNEESDNEAFLRAVWYCNVTSA